MINNILDRTQLEGKTVGKILEILGEKFMQTYPGKTQEMLENMVKLQKIDEDKSEEQIWDCFRELISEFEKIKLGECLRYMLGMMLINGLEKGQKITEEEKR